MVLFEGNQTDTARFLATIAGKRYVYELCRPDGTPFYVGKGLGRRALAHEAEARQYHSVGESNPFKCNVIRKILREGKEVLYRIDSQFDMKDELTCLEREAHLIRTYKRLHEGGHLTNLAGGIGNLSGAAPFSIDRHAATLSGSPEDNPERAILNNFLQSIGPVASVPIKPKSQIARILPTTPHPSPRRPTLRCAYALIASAAANALQLTDGVRIPRSFTFEGVEAIIENGVSRDLVKANMAILIPNADPQHEEYQMTSGQIAKIQELVGAGHLIERGLG